MIKVYYLLSEKGRKDSLLKGGDGKHLQVMNLEPIYKNFQIVDKSMEEILKLKSTIVNKDGEGYVAIGFTLSEEKYILNSPYKAELSERGSDREPCIVEVLKKKEFDKIPTLEELIEFEKKRLKGYEESCKAIEQEYTAKRNLFLKEQEYKHLAMLEKKRQEELLEKKKQILNEENRLKTKLSIENWIDNNGSNYLKNLKNKNYNYLEQYSKEFRDKNLVLKDFIIDLFNNAEYEIEDTPSEKALDYQLSLERKGYENSIIILTKMPIENADSEDFDLDIEKEAIRYKIGDKFYSYFIIE